MGVSIVNKKDLGVNLNTSFWSDLETRVCPKCVTAIHKFRKAFARILFLASLSNRLRGASHYGRRAESTGNKLFSWVQGRSPLKYTNSGVCTSLERKVCLLEESLGFHNYCRQTFLNQTNSHRQNFQKVLPCRHFGDCCPLAYSRVIR
jgi:hypothetical protein